MLMVRRICCESGLIMTLVWFSAVARADAAVVQCEPTQVQIAGAAVVRTLRRMTVSESTVGDQFIEAAISEDVFEDLVLAAKDVREQPTSPNDR